MGGSRTAPELTGGRGRGPAGVLGGKNWSLLGVQLVLVTKGQKIADKGRDGNRAVRTSIATHGAMRDWVAGARSGGRSRRGWKGVRQSVDVEV